MRVSSGDILLDVAKSQEAETFRRVAFFGVFVSTVAALTGIIAVPAVFGYLLRVQSALQVITMSNCVILSIILINHLF